jgi:hypothetical protein
VAGVDSGSEEVGNRTNVPAKRNSKIEEEL